MRHFHRLLLVLFAASLLACGQKPPAPGSDGPGSDAAAPGSATAADGRRTVVFLQPHDDPFWTSFVSFMREAAHDLDLRLVVANAGDGRGRMVAQAREALAATPKPAALLFQNFKQNGVELLDLAEAAGVPAFLVNAGVPAEAGAPRASRAHWIGEMLPDDEAAGEQLATVLFEGARARKLQGPDGKLHVVAIHGGAAEQASLDRVAGLKRVVAASADVVLHQIVPGNWNRKQARAQAEGLVQRYPHTSVIWAANDNMALGALDGIGDAGGTRVLVGGIDWSPEAMPAIREGRLLASIGGHFVEGGWALVLIRDYLDGKDFASAPGGVRLRSKMGLITKANVGDYERLLADERWGPLDFTAFSRSINPQLGAYDFRWDVIVRAVSR